MDLLDYIARTRQDLRHGFTGLDSQGQRLTTIDERANRVFQSRPRNIRSSSMANSGIWFSELLQHTAKIADEIGGRQSVHTEAINHDPAVTYIQTGNQIPGKPSLGSWLSYGLGQRMR
jgi:hypothetical protein